MRLKEYLTSKLDDFTTFDQPNKDRQCWECGVREPSVSVRYGYGYNFPKLCDDCDHRFWYLANRAYPPIEYWEVAREDEELQTWMEGRQ